MRHIIAIVVVAGLCMQLARAQEPGPENQGLRLKLKIKHPPEVAKGKHGMRVELSNVGTKAITLEAAFYYENKGTFRDWFKSDLGFEARPATPQQIFSTAGGERTSPQPTHVIQPGKSFVLEWETDDTLEDRGHKLLWASSGQFGVRAVLRARIKDSTRPCWLYSNEQPFLVGGSRRLPKTGIGKITAIDGGKKTVSIDLGRAQMIEIGDRFRASYGKQASWMITITKFGYYGGAIGTIEMVGKPAGRVPAWPKRGWGIRYAGKKKK